MASALTGGDSTVDARRAPDLLERRSLVDTGLHRPRDDALSEALCGPWAGDV